MSAYKDVPDGEVVYARGPYEAKLRFDQKHANPTTFPGKAHPFVEIRNRRLPGVLQKIRPDEEPFDRVMQWAEAEARRSVRWHQWQNFKTSMPAYVAAAAAIGAVVFAALSYFQWRLAA